MKHKLLSILFVMVACVGLSFGQGSLTVTTLSKALPYGGQNGTAVGASSVVYLGSCTNVNNPTLPVAGGPAIGDPSAAPYTYLVVDKEVMKVNSVLSTSPCSAAVDRAFTGSLGSGHNAGQTVYVVAPSQVLNIDPVGSCTSTLTRTQPAISYTTSSIWTCDATTGQWARVSSIDNTSGLPPAFVTTENGANNAIACSAGCGPFLVKGLEVTVTLAHSLQIGANTFAYNGGSAVSIKSHLNPANNLTAAYVSGGVITMVYNGTAWLDISQ